MSTAVTGKKPVKGDPLAFRFIYQSLVSLVSMSQSPAMGYFLED